MSIAPNTLSVNRGLDRNDIILVYNIMRIKQEVPLWRHPVKKCYISKPQPSEQTAALKTVLVRMGVRIKNVEAVSAGQTVAFC